MLSLSPIIDSLVVLSGVLGVYTPKGGEPVELLAIAGRDVQDAAANRQVRRGVRAQDWLIPTQCNVNGVTITTPIPGNGDRLRITYQDRETVWEVRAEGQQLPWEWSDREKRLRRVHFVEIDEEMGG